jgi:hypothetical protein
MTWRSLRTTLRFEIRVDNTKEQKRKTHVKVSTKGVTATEEQYQVSADSVQHAYRYQSVNDHTIRL